MNGYWAAVAVGAGLAAAACVLARRSERARTVVGRVLAIVLLADAITFFVRHGGGAPPLNLCDLALVVAAVTCWFPLRVGVELTWFWGMAGTLQAVATPDLSATPGELDFWLFVVGVVYATTGTNYMFLRARPEHASLLSVLGPWPWYIVSAAGVALVLLAVLDAPFRLPVRSRTCSPARAPSPGASGYPGPARSWRADA